MAAALPAKLKEADIAQFAQRATQLHRFKPAIAYWLRYLMIKRIMERGLHQFDADCKAYTTDLMDKLEQTKADHPTEAALSDENVAYATCEQFALETFARADNAMRANKVTAQTADTMRAASTFFDMLSIWPPLKPDIVAKQKYAKYHTLRIVKAIKAGEDPNLSNPVEQAPPPLDPDDPEVKAINEGAPPQASPQASRRPYVESAPDTSAQPSPTFSAAKVSPPPTLPSAPTGYGSQSTSAPQFPSHRDVSPISQPANSRHGSVDSVGGGYFPRVDVPTFTSENAAPSLPTAPSVEDEQMTSPFEASAIPPAAPGPDPRSFYQNQTQPEPAQAQAPPVQSPPLQNPYQTQEPHFTSPPAPPAPQQPPFVPSSAPPPQQYQYSAQSTQQQPPPQQYAQPMTGVVQNVHQGPFNSDEEAVLDAQKHAKWAISALNFEDVNTAVSELRIALKALGAS